MANVEGEENAMIKATQEEIQHAWHLFDLGKQSLTEKKYEEAAEQLGEVLSLL